MPPVIDSKIFSKSPSEIREAFETLLTGSERRGYFGIVEHSDAGLARLVARNDVRAGYYCAAFITVRALATRLAARAVLPSVLEAAWAASKGIPDVPGPPNLSKLKARLYRVLPTPAEAANFKKLNTQFLALHKSAMEISLFSVGSTLFDWLRDAVLAAQEGSGVEPPDPVPSPTPEELATTTTETTATLQDAGVPRMRTRERREVIDRNPLSEQPVPPITNRVLISSPPWRIYGEEIDPDPYWVRWTTVEWPPLARSEFHMAFVHDPVHDISALPWAKKGDAPALTELPGGTMLKGTDSIRYTNGHIGRTWHDKLQRYWVEMPERANFVRLGERIHFHTTQFLDSQDDFLDWDELRRLIEEQLEKQDVEDKIEEKVKELLEDMLSSAGSILGQPIGSAAGPAAKGAAALAMEGIEWLIEAIFGRPDFHPILTAHTTLYNGASAPISTVAWSKGGGTPGQDPRPLAPLKLKPQYHTLPPADRYESIGEEVIAWSGESRVPENRPTPAQLVNTRTSPVFWPPSYDYGGHVFIPVSTEDGDGNYAVALRTEVRLAFVTFEP
jgi:hypothetical protein